MKRPGPGLLTLVAILLFSFPVRGIELDSTFGPGGVVTTYVDDAEAVALAAQADGKIVVLGGNDSQNGSVDLVRYTRTGALDPSFGSGGVAKNFGYPSFFAPSAVALQADGKIVVAGGVSEASGQSFFVARFLTSGTPDASFGSGGLVTTVFPTGFASARAVAIQRDAKIVAAGSAGPVFPETDGDYAGARYNSDGTLDPSFGSGGRAVIDMGGRMPESAAGLVIEHDGRIVLAGLTDSSSGNGCALAGLLPDGSLDASFGAAGRVFLSAGQYTDCEAITLQRDGKIVAAGQSFSPDGMLAVRLFPDGSLDQAFGVGGIATTSVPAGAHAVSVDRQGRIVLAGGGSAQFVLARLLPGGGPDTTLGPQGCVKILGGSPPHFQAQANAVVVQADGGIVLAGGESEVVIEAFALVRYAGDAAAIPTLSTRALFAYVALLGVVGLLIVRRAL